MSPLFSIYGIFPYIENHFYQCRIMVLWDREELNGTKTIFIFSFDLFMLQVMSPANPLSLTKLNVCKKLLIINKPGRICRTGEGGGIDFW